MRLGPGPGIGRLTRRSEFLAAAGGRRFHSPRMSLQGLRRQEPVSQDPAHDDQAHEHLASSGLRVGFTVTKRVGHATERNRIRRRLRRAVLAAGADWAAEPLDLVVVGRRDALGSPFPVLVEDLSKGLRAVTRGAGRERRSEGEGARPPAVAP